jgi:hypothetical protein
VLFTELSTFFTGSLGAEGNGPNANIKSLLNPEYYPNTLTATNLILYTVPVMPSESSVYSRVNNSD